MNAWGTGPYGKSSWTMRLLYDSLPDDWRAKDEQEGYPWKRYIQTIEPIFEELLARCDHPEVLFDAQRMRPEWLPLLSRSLGLSIDRYYSEDWRRSSIRFANQWWAKKGTDASLEYLAEVYGFNAIIAEVWEDDGRLTFTAPPARPRMDEFPADWIPVDSSRPRGAREILGSWLDALAGATIANTTWVNGSDVVTGTGFLLSIGPVGVALSGVFIFNSIDSTWYEVEEVLGSTSIRLTAAWVGAGGVSAGTRIYPVSTRLTGLVVAYGPGHGRTALGGTLSFVNGSAQVSGSGTSFLDELGGFVERGEDVFIWLDADGAWAKVLSVQSQTILFLTTEYPDVGGTGAASWTEHPCGDPSLAGAATAFVAEVGDCSALTWFELESDGGWNQVAEVVSNTAAELAVTYPWNGGVSRGRVSVEGRVQLYDQAEDCTYKKTDLIYVSLSGDQSQALTGTITISGGSDQVVGVGTAFLSEIDLGEIYIKVDTGSTWHRVLSVEDDEHLTLDAEAAVGIAGAAHWSPRTVTIAGINVDKALSRVLAKLARYVKPVHVRMLVDFNVPIDVPPFVVSAGLTAEETVEIEGLLGQRFDAIPADGIDVDDPFVVTMTVSSP